MVYKSSPPFPLDTMCPNPFCSLPMQTLKCNHHTIHATPKEWWESITSLQFHSSHAHRVFNEITVFSANAPHLILQPTDQFLPHRFCLPLTIIKKQQRREKNGEKWLSVDDFLVLMLTIFSIKMLISVPICHTWYHSPQTNYCTATSAAHLLLLKSSRDTKRMVRNDWVLMIFQFFCSPFFNEIAFFSASMPHMILQPTDRFLSRRFRRLLTIIKIQQWHEK